MVDSKKFTCSDCQFATKTRYCLDVHLATKKHIRNVSPHLTRDANMHCCKTCNNQYKFSSGLYAHVKKCSGVKRETKESTDGGQNGNDFLVNELKKMNERIDALSNEVHSRQIVTSNINNNITTVTNNININVFLNETCKNAINLDSFIKNLMFELADSKLMIGSYVEGTCSILQKNLNGLPLNKRPMHCMEGEDPNQQLMHIRQDDKWNIGTYVNWLEQIYSDDDDDVVNKNPIYYALKMIDDEKLKYLGYNYFQNDEYKVQHSRLHSEISRQDLKIKVYDRLLKMITVDPPYIK